MKKIIILAASIISMNANAEIITTKTISNPPSCNEGHACDVYSVHEIYIKNNDSTPHNYQYNYQLCVKVNTTNYCDHVGNTITVYPGQQWNNSRLSSFHSKLPSGKYEYIVQTEVLGKSNDVKNYMLYVN